MATLKKHRLVAADFRSAYDWYEDQRPGLGLEFTAEFRNACFRLRHGPMLYAIPFDKIRRLILDWFPCARFYSVQVQEILVLGIFHASRDTVDMLQERRGSFRF